MSENTATTGGGAIASAAGTVSLVNSTISGNAAGGAGGGIDVLSGSLSLHSVTIAMNQAERGGGIANEGGRLSSVNSILGSNTAVTGPDIYGSLASGGNNLIEHRTDAALLSLLASDIIGQRPRLAPLSDYGGTTRTHALLSASPAIGAGITSANRTDQRGQRRLVAFGSRVRRSTQDGWLGAAEDGRFPAQSVLRRIGWLIAAGHRSALEANACSSTIDLATFRLGYVRSWRAGSLVTDLGAPLSERSRVEWCVAARTSTTDV